jgi:hypothetical protein
LPSRTTMAMCGLHSRCLPSMRRTWCCCRRVSKPCRGWPKRSVWSLEEPL